MSTPIALLHMWGFPCAWTWSAATGSETLLPIDLPGYGEVPPAARIHGELESAAEYVADRTRAHFDGRPAVLVGFSLGGAVAKLVARDHPEVVAGLVLFGSACRWSRGPWRAMPLIRRALEAGGEPAWSLIARAAGMPSQQRRRAAPALARQSAAAVCASGAALGRFDSTRWASTLGIRSTVVVTTRDRRQPPAAQQALARALGAHTVQLPRDHDVVFTEPERVLELALEQAERLRA